MRETKYLIQRCVHSTTPFTEQRKLSLTRIKRGVGGPGAQLSKRTSTLVSSLRNRCHTSPQLAASLNSTRKTPVSMSTVKRRLRDAVQCLCYFAHLNLLFLLPSLRYGFFFSTLPRRPASLSHLFTVDVETGVLQVLFNEVAS